mgnify:CR=1 FL=1
MLLEEVDHTRDLVGRQLLQHHEAGVAVRADLAREQHRDEYLAVVAHVTVPAVPRGEVTVEDRVLLEHQLVQRLHVLQLAVGRGEEGVQELQAEVHLVLLHDSPR